MKDCVDNSDENNCSKAFKSSMNLRNQRFTVWMFSLRIGFDSGFILFASLGGEICYNLNKYNTNYLQTIPVALRRPVRMGPVTTTRSTATDCRTAETAPMNSTAVSNAK